ncbi:MAG: hypothetical protein HGN29_14725 [Asgard group archaeon]|nr:hypothetical protein [Asgard group archaeon]
MNVEELLKFLELDNNGHSDFGQLIEIAEESVNIVDYNGDLLNYLRDFLICFLNHAEEYEKKFYEIFHNLKEEQKEDSA